MNREKIAERVNFSEDERWEMLEKSDQKCAHCGKPIFAIPGIANSMTVDHYIPLAKGGTNRKINLIALCKKCNKEKSDKIVNPEGYLKYLKKEYMDEIKGYYESYTHSFKYVSENQLLADDEFVINVPYYPCNGVRGRNVVAHIFQYTVKKAAYCDLDRILDYYISYLKKYGALESKELAYKNIREWFENGCMYYVEKEGKICILVAFDVIHEANSKSKRAIEIWAFSYYNRQQMGELLSSIIMELPKKILRECHIPALPVVISVVRSDKIYKHLTLFKGLFSSAGDKVTVDKFFTVISLDEKGHAHSCKPRCLTSEQQKQVDQFMSQFKVIA